jgi:hypothetical protein
MVKRPCRSIIKKERFSQEMAVKLKYCNIDPLVSQRRKYLFSLAGLFLFLLTIYSNSFDGDWHLDDYPNIVYNKNIQMESLTWESLKKAIQGPRHAFSTFNRPLSFLSFAINYYIGGLNVLGYHVVNFFLHYATAVLAFFILNNLFEITKKKTTDYDSGHFIAFLSVLFWSIHPLHVSSVTYIVQRMTILAAMFYLMAIYFYIKARIQKRKSVRYALFVSSAMASFSALACKENAAMIPVTIFLIEWLVFNGIKKSHCVVALVAVTVGVGLFFASPDFIKKWTHLNGYVDRPFTLKERLLTEPRVIFFYLSLLFLPSNERFALLHDFNPSKGLMVPWTTWASLCLLVVIGLCLLKFYKRYSMMSFCILFFFINHVMEGTIIPLELVFEHRNYLPSCFIFVPICMLIQYFMRIFKNKNAIPLLFYLAIVLVVVANGHTTYQRNQMFSNEILLWRDNIKKYPMLHRPHHCLGKAMIAEGMVRGGIEEMKKALRARSGGRIDQKYITYYNLGICYYHMRRYKAAMDYFKQTTKIQPTFAPGYAQMARVCIKQGEFSQAKDYLKQAIKRSKNNKKYLRILKHLEHKSRGKNKP